ncbi:cytochrome-c oxidase, cbb3-type subunit III [Govanella unica]|uniref:Cbb3-type cytochrome c oxidase subunit n=1 Tax=Govanella unica TaxID=2975056 RepID=A0A9X3TZ43_9PROT|nr:cytochrome-c oxidase, cbb3-type subunit III [Govania unica]MDA5194458.1 cytochrome-c oxidase, cbb3-type subunit III [Govania unica]
MNHETLVAFSKSWGLFYMIGLAVLVLVYVFWPANRKRFDQAKNSILDTDDRPKPAPMEPEKHDHITGRKTTGHEWNGIEELDTPVPRIVLWFLALTTLFAIIYWILMPAWPTGWSYTKGLLGIDQREVVMRQVDKAAADRAVWTDRIAAADFKEIAAAPKLMQYVRDRGQALFGDNCAVCHGVRGTGGPGFPDLAARAWIWGGSPDAIAETIRVGINTTVDGTRTSQMLAFGREGMLDREQVLSVTAHVRSLSGQTLTAEETARLGAGKEIFADNCSACHGEAGRGQQELGAPNLTDSVWLYGGDAQSVYTSVYSGRQGHMPHWSDRLPPTDIKILALYVGTLGEGQP